MLSDIILSVLMLGMAVLYVDIDILSVIMMLLC